ncbi:hypothetical protein BgiMline_030788 [Biomphalaria glabrata]
MNGKTSSMNGKTAPMNEHYEMYEWNQTEMENIGCASTVQETSEKSIGHLEIPPFYTFSQFRSIVMLMYGVCSLLCPSLDLSL